MHVNSEAHYLHQCIGKPEKGKRPYSRQHKHMPVLITCLHSLWKDTNRCSIVIATVRFVLNEDTFKPAAKCFPELKIGSDTL